MNPAILQEDVQDFIKSFGGDTTALAFKGSPFPNVPITELIEQIVGYRKAEKKLPNWHHSPGIYYPHKLNLEQCSSETTAKYKASLVKGNSLVDITGGFGVDVYHFASHFEKVYHFEQDERLSAIAKHNFNALGIHNVATECVDGLKGIQDHTFDVIYTDPARRHASKGKVFFLKDCEPDVVSHLDFLLERCDTLLLKTSPMLDITAAIADLKYVKEIHIVAVENDVKELLWIVQKRVEGTINMVTCNFTKEKAQLFECPVGGEYDLSFEMPGKYLYEPNAAIMKSGNFGAVARTYGLGKLHTHSHLYTSEALKDFPGRVFDILEVIPYQKKNMAPFKNTKANVATRNFSENVASLRKKWRIADGGDVYLFFTTNANNERVVLKCKKVGK
ncbi:class I SAM-dependent methyltransferase [Aureisphaera galaxeae]|uniref:THUMP-like domain-containing protein n=1 Tax=Aureisphaera galaxeae TaxID=1538023 RepID=UPI002350F8C1|nr:class I SAM-dependent methyltransferase [Aureisphaera galaxeae]MDC8004165.1 class I SAM-dependent methyltransferase [Aureisphaera galaxeae]